MDEPMIVRNGLAKLKAGEAETFVVASIPAGEREAWRATIEDVAAQLDLEVVIRDDTDPWLTTFPADQLVVLRFSDYLTAYGVPA